MSFQFQSRLLEGKVQPMMVVSIHVVLYFYGLFRNVILPGGLRW